MFANRLIKPLLAGLLGAAAFLFVTPASSFAGAVGGPKVGASDVDAHSYDNYNVRFYGGEQAVVVIRGDGDTVLVAKVYDENGHLVATDSDGDGTGVVLLRWTPTWSGTFTVRIINPGSVYNHYRIETN